MLAVVGRPRNPWLPLLVIACCAPAAGCLSSRTYHPGIEPAPYGPTAANGTYFADPRYDGTLPRELQKISMPEYVIEPPDILRIELLRVSPTKDYKLEPQDILTISITYPAQTEPFGGDVMIGPDGQINLGTTFGGTIKLAGLTIEQAKAAIEETAQKANVKSPRATVSLTQSRSLVPIRGEYIVRPDGSVGLGTYDSVRVVGLSLSQAKRVIEQHLSTKLNAPEVAVDIAAYNSKVYYVIYDGGGRGQQVVRLPITGNDTVLDAVAQLNGLSPVSSQHHMWIARPAPAAMNQTMVLPIDWIGVTKGAQTATNYQLLPGDRIYVKANPLITIDNYIAMILSPIERGLGVTLLGQSTVQALINPQSIGAGGAR